MIDDTRIDGLQVDQLDDATWAVVAHGLLNTLATVVSSAKLLRSDWSRLAPADRELLLGVVVEQAETAGGVLDDMARGLPAEASEYLGRR